MFPNNRSSIAVFVLCCDYLPSKTKHAHATLKYTRPTVSLKVGMVDVFEAKYKYITPAYIKIQGIDYLRTTYELN